MQNGISLAALVEVSVLNNEKTDFCHSNPPSPLHTEFEDAPLHL